MANQTEFSIYKILINQREMIMKKKPMKDEKKMPMKKKGKC